MASQPWIGAPAAMIHGILPKEAGLTALVHKQSNDQEPGG